MLLPKPAANGTLPSIADSGAAPVTVRNKTPIRPTALAWSLSTDLSLPISKLSCASRALAVGDVTLATPPGVHLFERCWICSAAAGDLGLWSSLLVACHP